MGVKPLHLYFSSRLFELAFPTSQVFFKMMGVAIDPLLNHYFIPFRYFMIMYKY